MFMQLFAFFNETFFQGFIGNAIASLLAVLAGVPLGLRLDRMIKDRSRALQVEQLRAALKRAVEHNLGTLVTVREQLEKQVVPTFSLDLALFDATSHSKYDVLNDISLCTSIDHLRFELSHLGRQLDALLHLELDSSSREAGNFVEGRKLPLYDAVHPQLVNGINTRLPHLEAECRQILEILKST